MNDHMKKELMDYCSMQIIIQSAKRQKAHDALNDNYKAYNIWADKYDANGQIKAYEDIKNRLKNL